MRTKKGKPVDVAAINSAWQGLFDQNKTNSIEELKKDGWISIYEASKKMNRTRAATKAALEKIGAEYQLFPILVGGIARRTGFFRLKC
jgi:hypothetical protein